jgi:hypothetical protein
MPHVILSYMIFGFHSQPARRQFALPCANSWIPCLGRAATRQDLKHIHPSLLLRSSHSATPRTFFRLYLPSAQQSTTSSSVSWQLVRAAPATRPSTSSLAESRETTICVALSCQCAYIEIRKAGQGYISSWRSIGAPPQPHLPGPPWPSRGNPNVYLPNL